MTSFTRTLNPADAALQEAGQAFRAGRLPETIAAAQRCVALAPAMLPAWWLWGLAAIDGWAYSEAEQVLAEGLKHLPVSHPLRVRFLSQRARALVSLGRYGDAVASVSEAVKASPGDAATFDLLGTTLVNAMREADALPLVCRATELEPSNGAYWHSRGNVEQFLGLIDDAESSYETALRLAANPSIHLALARLRRWTRDRNHIDRLKAMPAATPIDEARKGYALFKELDDVGETQGAWEWLQKGAEAARRQTITPENPGWSAAAEAATVDAWIDGFPAQRFAKPQARRATASPRHIFIVGLPRSGTTLVERILTAHSRVKALGELQTFPATVKTLTGTPGWQLLDEATVRAAASLDPARIAEVYDRETAYLSEDHAHVIDKLPHNHDYAGLIRLAFPDALIIHVRREPMDALFGAYKLHFAASWSFDQNDLADHFQAYRRLMEHWKTCLGDGLIDVSLEAIIAEPETQIRRLLDACDLPFEDACLRPHEAQGAVATASSTQVRSPINAEGVGAWRRYEAGLDPLRRRLERAGVIDADGRARA